MPLPVRSFCISVFPVLLLVAVVSPADDPAPKPIPSEAILQRFAITKGADCVLVPVKIGGKEHQFLLDTGMGRTCFDPSLLAGEPQGTANLVTANGEVKLTLYDAPKGTVGDLPLTPPNTQPVPVLAMDMTPFREASGHPIDGVLGIDFLDRHVLQIDSDRGELLFLKWAPANIGESIPFNWNKLNVPEITANVAGIGKAQFVIDTGMVGEASGQLRGEDVRIGLRGGSLVQDHTTEAVTGAGTAKSILYQGRRLDVGPFAVEKPVFAAIEKPADGGSESNLLGMSFMSRFVVTIDFPKGLMYLRKGDRYAKADRWNKSGISLVKKGSAVTVDRVDEGSAAAAAEIRKGDVVLKIGSRQADTASLAELWEELLEPGRVTCVFSREGTKRLAELDIPGR
jgi:hypothetical protein